VRVLVVEDEPRLCDQLVSALTEAGYAVDRAADGDEAQRLGEVHPYDAVVLDLALPRVDGLTVLRRWRASGIKVPVVVLTARGSWHEKVNGIDAGADDYVAKPFRMEELLARVRALIRRASGAAVAAEIRTGAIALDTRSGRVTLDGLPVALTAHELRVLSYLLHHRDRVVSRTELSEHIYAEDLDRDSNTIEVFVARLRRKLGANVVRTVRGLGYRIDAS
jgi:two-component system, OmpR family, response regulator